MRNGNDLLLHRPYFGAMLHTALFFFGFVYFALIFGQILRCAFRSSEPKREQEIFDACMLRPPKEKRR
jgi:hypothetical protein